MDRAFNEALRDLKQQFAAQIEDHRSALFAYCLHLTGDGFQAEELHQETVLKAFAKLSERFETLRHPRAYLFRVATRTWLDWRKRRSVVIPVAELDAADPSPPPSSRHEIEQALDRLIRHLPPRELAALLLRDVYDLQGAEAAAVLGTTVPAVKMAVVRARRRLRALPSEEAQRGVPGPAPDVLKRFVDAFLAHDADALGALLHEHAVGRAVGCAEEEGRDEILRGTLRYALAQTDVRRISIERYRGQDLVAFWYGEPEAVGDLLRVEIRDGAITATALYWFCPDLLLHVGHELGLPVVTHGYGPEPGFRWWNE